VLNSDDAPLSETRQLLWLKRWIWVYFWLLIFEGVLRKWILPSLSGPLLVIRDPVALIIYFQAARCRQFTSKVMWPISLLAAMIVPLALAQVVLGIVPPWVALYGLRSYLLHLPLVLVMAETLTVADIRRFGRWLLLLSVPMTALVIAQYYAPMDSWLNVGAGEGAGQISASGGHIRPAATFSYGAGAQFYVMLTVVFILYSMTRKQIYPRWLLWSAALSMVAIIPALGSRTVIFSLAVIAVFLAVAGLRSAAGIARLAKLSVFLLAIALLVSQLPFFKDASATMMTRFDEASHSEGSIQDVLELRILGVFESGFESAGVTNWLGQGIGMGSNFAAVITTGSKSFLLAEMEWERIILEFGPICGLLFLGFRVVAAVYISVQATKMLHRNDALAWLLLPAVIPPLIFNSMEQPTYLGFAILNAGICLAASRMRLSDAR
jgi:hypothetical protein